MNNFFDEIFDNINCNENDSANMMPYMRVGYTYVPNQAIKNTYSPEKALIRGTVFPELDIPMREYGKQYGKQEDNNDQ